MSTTGWIIIVALAIVIVAVLGLLAAARVSMSRRRAHLREQFGPEYDRTVERAPSRDVAEQELEDRERDHDELELRPLSDAARTRFLRDWEVVQKQFVDDPERAAAEAERLVRSVMRERGYPADSGSKERADAISVEHPDVVQRYREGCDALETRSGGSEERTENLRRAMVDFRAVFETLLEGEREMSAAR